MPFSFAAWRHCAACFALLALSQAAQAQTAVPYTFAAGSPAKAGEVNANFQALVTAVNNLGSRVNKLEGQLAANDVPGKYSLSTVNLSPVVGTPVGGRWDVNVVKATLTLAANGTFTSTGTESSGNCCGSGTWTLAGNALSLTFDGSEVTTFQALAVGNLFVTTKNTSAGSSNQLVILARLR